MYDETPEIVSPAIGKLALNLPVRPTNMECLSINGQILFEVSELSSSSFAPVLQFTMNQLSTFLPK